MFTHSMFEASGMNQQREILNQASPILEKRYVEYFPPPLESVKCSH